MSAQEVINGRLLVSASPHVKSNDSIPKIMWSVNAALTPVALYSIYLFGAAALNTLLLCIGSAVFILRKLVPD